MQRSLLACAACIALAAPKTRAAEQPNILLIVSDDLGFNDVGFHGSEIQTPFIDSLAHAGVILDHYYGHSICTPSRSSIMSGRYASHTGLQHSYLLTGTDVGLPLKFKSLANHMNEQGYASHCVGKWHLGFQSYAYTPRGRGFASYFGYLTGGEDYFTHMVGKYADLHENETPALNYNGSYSTPLFANKTIDIIAAHNASLQPLFIYLAFQSVHSPLQAPTEWVEKYSWITATSRRTLAAMTSCMDYEISRIVASLKAKEMWTNTLLVMVADNGGPPYVANSNWPMRGGKWTMWEGGTHLAAFAVHGGGLLPQKRFAGLAHHADWAATFVEAAGGKMNDTVLPAPDSVSLWSALTSADPAVVGPRDHVLLNVDQTNQVDPNDPGGWSGYAGVVVKSAALGHFKLMLGNPGVPNSWCWPNQVNESASAAVHHPAVNNGIIRDVTLLPPTERSGEGEGVAAGPEHGTLHAPSCHVLPAVSYHANDIKTVNGNAGDCCGICTAVAGCKGWTWRAATTATATAAAASSGSEATAAACWLKTSLEPANKGSCNGNECQSGYIGTLPPPAPPPAPAGPIDPMPDNSTLTCGYNGKIPGNKTGAILFNLATDPVEKHNLAVAQPANVALLMKYLQPFIDSAVPPLNEFKSERASDPRAAEAAANASCWVPWE